MDILKSRIVKKIKELNIDEHILYDMPIIKEGYDQIDTVILKLKSVSRVYLWFYLPLACLLLSLVFIASLWQVFDNEFSSKWIVFFAILFGIRFFYKAWRYRCMIERMKMMLFLIELKNEVK